MAKNNIINIQSDDFAVLANKIDKIGRFELPVATRNTINQLAVNMKGGRGATVSNGLVSESAKKTFQYQRSKNIFNIMTGFNKTRTSDINNMKAVAGIAVKSGKDKLARNLGAQAEGKKVRQKATPYTKTRRGKAQKGRLARRLYVENVIEGAIDLRGLTGRQFITGAIKSYKEQRHVILGRRGQNAYVAEVLDFDRDSGTVDFHNEVHYRLNQSGTVKPKKERNFVATAALISMRDVDVIFKKEAQKRVTKAMKK